MPNKGHMGIRERWIPTLVSIAVLTAAGSALAACGDDADNQRLQDEKLEQARLEGKKEALAEDRVTRNEQATKALRAELNRLKKQRQKNGSTSNGGSNSGSGAASVGSTSCGNGVSANSVTSCPFAQNVAETYRRSSGASSIDVYSPVTGRNYVMSCSGGIPTVCSGGNGAVVYIR